MSMWSVSPLSSSTTKTSNNDKDNKKSTTTSSPPQSHQRINDTHKPKSHNKKITQVVRGNLRVHLSDVVSLQKVEDVKTGKKVRVYLILFYFVCTLVYWLGCVGGW